jgi:5-methyltetrahydrofolate--homocysteine methyltransferase
VLVSGTFVDQSGRTLSGPTGEAFYASMRHAKPMCVGWNCALGAQHMVPFVERLAKCVVCFFTCVFQCWITKCDGRIG